MSTDLVPVKNNLKDICDVGQLKQMITCKIQSIPNFQLLKSDVELILYACNTLENYCVDIKSNKLNKKELIVNVFTELFNLSDDEKVLLNNTIQFLFDHKKIKQVKQVIVLTKRIASWFMKKFA